MDRAGTDKGGRSKLLGVQEQSQGSAKLRGHRTNGASDDGTAQAAARF